MPARAVPQGRSRKMAFVVVTVIVVPVVLAVGLALILQKRRSPSPVDQQSAISRPDPPPAAPVETDPRAIDAELAKDPVSALGLVHLYESNEIDAERSSKGYRFVYQGRVDTIGRDVAGRPYLTMGRSEKGTALQCMFKASDEAQLAQLSRGQQVYVQGVVQGKAINVIMDDCRILDSTFIGADEILRTYKKAGINPRDLDSHSIEVAKRSPDYLVAVQALLAATDNADVLSNLSSQTAKCCVALVDVFKGKVTAFHFDPATKTMVQVNEAHISGSEQESGGGPILRSFPKDDEIGLGNRHTLGLEQQIA
jgi:hypothetical protein